MKGWLIGLFCSAFLAVTAACSPLPLAFADGGPLIPVSVEEFAWGVSGEMRVRKVYQLALTDTTRQIPRDDFERNGYLYRFLDMTKENSVGVDTKEYVESVKKDCKTNDTADALKLLEAEKSVTTPDGYSGKLLLDHASVKVSVKGYKTNSKNISATRVYSDLPDADLELVPKTITENENLLTLNDAQWESVPDDDGNLRFTAVAQYAGTATSRVATGYEVSANYTGHVVKLNCEMVTYTVIFAGTEIPKEPEPEPESEPPEPAPVPKPEIEPEASPETVPETEADAETETNEIMNGAETRENTETPESLSPTERNVLPVAECVGVCLIAITGIFLCALYCVRRKQKGERKTNDEI